jgi:group II intron reverse transcriptase/maturase
MEMRDVLIEQTMDEVLARENLRKAYRAVKRNQGSAGIDGRTIEQTGVHLRQHWGQIGEKLKAGTYLPSPVRGVSIPKASGGTRLLGIPTVQDRLIQQATGQILSERAEPNFSVHSYGFRPGKSAHDAVRAAQAIVKAGKTWVVDLDISAFFDQVDHDILMHRVGQLDRDKRTLRLIGRYLRAPIVIGAREESRTRGTPQGGPLSPVLANIYLDPLDKELERRGVSFCRYADDVNIYVGSQRSAERILTSISAWIEKHLKLKVNLDKSGTGRPWDRQFLGFTIKEDGSIAPAERSVERFKQATRKHWDARQSGTSGELVARWQTYLRGWCNYFGLARARGRINALEGWVRRHMRKCFWLRWHNRAGRLNALQRLGAPAGHWDVASSRRGAWRIAASPALSSALSNTVLRRYGLWVPSNLWTA